MTKPQVLSAACFNGDHDSCIGTSTWALTKWKEQGGTIRLPDHPCHCECHKQSAGEKAGLVRMGVILDKAIAELCALKAELK